MKMKISPLDTATQDLIKGIWLVWLPVYSLLFGRFMDQLPFVRAVEPGRPETWQIVVMVIACVGMVYVVYRFLWHPLSALAQMDEVKGHQLALIRDIVVATAGSAFVIWAVMAIACRVSGEFAQVVLYMAAFFAMDWLENRIPALSDRILARVIPPAATAA